MLTAWVAVLVYRGLVEEVAIFDTRKKGMEWLDEKAPGEWTKSDSDYHGAVVECPLPSEEKVRPTAERNVCDWCGASMPLGTVKCPECGKDPNSRF